MREFRLLLYAVKHSVYSPMHLKIEGFYPFSSNSSKNVFGSFLMCFMRSFSQHASD